MKLKIIAAFLLSTSIAFAKPTALAQAATNPITTRAGTLTDLYSAHKITITSDKPGSTMFYWGMSLCPDTQTDRCVSFMDHTSLQKGMTFSKTYQLHTSVVFQASGGKPVTAKTHIWGGAESWGQDTEYADVY